MFLTLINLHHSTLYQARYKLHKESIMENKQINAFCFDGIIDLVLISAELCWSVYNLFISEDNTESNRQVDCTRRVMSSCACRIFI